ncbi:MAG: hypothetical protein ACYC35_25180 [Pirellulales bacterium]
MDRRTFVKTMPALAMLAGGASVLAEEPEQRVLFAQTVGRPLKS